MPICVISTTGTSIFSNAHVDLKSEWQAFRNRTDVDLQAISRRGVFNGSELYQCSLEYLRAEAKAVDAREVIRKSSAELNSLTLILADQRTRSDQLHFLATATPDGVLAARVIADFSRDYFQIENVSIHLIDGLQVNDGEAFQRDGVRNLIAKIYDVLRHAPEGTYKRVINPTGGFKGVVPYLTLIGMIEPGVDLSYIYEQSPALITLGRVPLQFNFEILDSAYRALKACSEDFVDQQQLSELLNLSAVQTLTDHPAWSLFDQTSQEGKIYFSVNGLGLIVLEHFKSLYKTKIYFSRHAAERFDSLDNTQQRKFEGYFERLRDPDWIKSHRHDDYANEGNAIAIKPGNVDERLFIYQLDDGSILVAELAFHQTNGSYDREPKRRKDYDSFRLWEVK
ncbi:MAG: hypothetical protein SGJ24_18410 [Chloroflexota bacterium]|nr:hypothetical protein [Chloroflexota bacterium]